MGKLIDDEDWKTVRYALDDWPRTLRLMAIIPIIASPGVVITILLLQFAGG